MRIVVEGGVDNHVSAVLNHLGPDDVDDDDDSTHLDDDDTFVPDDNPRLGRRI